MTGALNRWTFSLGWLAITLASWAILVPARLSATAVGVLGLGGLATALLGGDPLTGPAAHATPPRRVPDDRRQAVPLSRCRAHPR